LAAGSTPVAIDPGTDIGPQCNPDRPRIVQELF
jgi:hypothetical protein